MSPVPGGISINKISKYPQFTSRINCINADCTIFYNGGHIGPATRASARAYTHFELESLPSGGWGYLHFPVALRYARTLCPECLGMTGKFHTSWGDFHSFKNPKALEFECFNMLALAAKCSIGDQLHPTGRICPTTYELIGDVYAQVELKEPWCRRAVPLADIGVLTPEAFTGSSDHTALPPAIFGVAMMLQEAAHQFDIIDDGGDLQDYKLIILPDTVPCDEPLAERIEAYLARGGAVIASHEAGLDPENGDFALKSLGVKLTGPAPFSPDFIRPRQAFAGSLPATEMVMYLRGTQVEPAHGAEVLADVLVPYFNRDYRHFCSHKHTPSAGTVGYPGVVANGKAIYFAHPIFTQYHDNAPLWCKRLLLNAVQRLLPNPLVRLDAPSTALATINSQEAENRWVLHLLHYIPQRRGIQFDVIEDVIPLLNVPVSVKVPRPIKDVTCVPEGKMLDFQVIDGRVDFVLPMLQGHQMIALIFA